MGLIGTKPAFKSVTIVSALIAMAASALNAMGVNLAADVIPNLNAIVAGVAAAVAIYGRITAKTVIA
jgi:uncharacterized membrane protein